MLNGGGNIALDEQVVSSDDRDVLWDPPVVCGEGEGCGTCCAVDGDLIAARDVEGDGIGWCLTENSAVDDGGAGIFCEAWPSCSCSSRKSLLLRSGLELMPGRTVVALSPLSVATVVAL